MYQDHVRGLFHQAITSAVGNRERVVLESEGSINVGQVAIDVVDENKERDSMDSHIVTMEFQITIAGRSNRENENLGNKIHNSIIQQVDLYERSQLSAENQIKDGVSIRVVHWECQFHVNEQMEVI